jgi:acetone carboxylase gamma subunit
VEKMETLNFVKNFRNGNGWEQAEITEQESGTIQEQLRKLNNQIYQECLQDAHEMLKRFIVPYSNPMPQIQQTADRLFEKRAIHSLTAYQEFLKLKINKLRNGNGNHREIEDYE